MLGNWSDTMLPVGVAAPSRIQKRYSDVIPSNVSAFVPEAAKLATAAAGSKRVSKEVVKPVPTTGVTNVPDPAMSSRATASAWTSTFASITAATPSPTLQVSTSNSPILEEQSEYVRSPPPAQPPHTPSSGDSDEERLLSPSQGSVHSPADVVSMEVGVAVGVAMDMNTEFPPLTMPHSCSKSEPQVSSLPAKAKQSQQSCDDITLIGASLAEQTVSVTSSWPKVAPLSLPSEPGSSEDVSPQLQLEKLPFTPSPPLTSPVLVEDTGGEEESSEGDHASPKTTTATTSEVGVVSSLAVGTRPLDAVKSVAVTQTTQQV